MQDALGVAIAQLLGLHPFLGLVAGSITLVGGHGTGAAYVEKFGAATGIPGVMALTMTSATIGLVLGGVIGGPVAERLIRRFGLKSATRRRRRRRRHHRPDGDAGDDGAVDRLADRGADRGADRPVARPPSGRCAGDGARFPAVPAGRARAAQWRRACSGLRLHGSAPDLLGSVCLSIFLAWTMMALDLASVFGMAGPLLIILAAQLVLVALWATFVTFRVVGRDYESAVMSAAFCGFAMGATATAIANMQALARRHGPAPQAFLIVPIVGAFFIDLVNAVVLTVFLSLDMMGFA